MGVPDPASQLLPDQGRFPVILSLWSPPFPKAGEEAAVFWGCPSSPLLAALYGPPGLLVNWLWQWKRMRRRGGIPTDPVPTTFLAPFHTDATQGPNEQGGSPCGLRPRPDWNIKKLVLGVGPWRPRGQLPRLLTSGGRIWQKSQSLPLEAHSTDRPQVVHPGPKFQRQRPELEGPLLHGVEIHLGCLCPPSPLGGGLIPRTSERGCVWRWAVTEVIRLQ